MAPSITPPRILEADRLTAIVLAGALHDELELDARLARPALRNCRITGGNMANVAVRGAIAEHCAFEGVRDEQADR